jgi:hypothetical protein
MPTIVLSIDIAEDVSEGELALIRASIRQTVEDDDSGAVTATDWIEIGTK